MALKTATAFAAAAISCAAMASVHTNTYLGGSVSLPESYDDGYVPQSGDFVKIGANTTLAATYGTDDWDFISSLGRIIPVSRNNCLVELTVPNAEDDVDFNVPISAYYFIYGDTQRYGKIVKKGAGRVCLTSLLKVDKTVGYDYYTKIHVKEGSLAMSSAEPKQNYLVGSITVDEGAKFVMPRGDNLSGGALYHDGLFGEGIVTNEYSSISVLQVYYNLSSGSIGEFHGSIGGRVHVTCAGDGVQYFYGKKGVANNVDITASSGTIGIERFYPGCGDGWSIGQPGYLRFGKSGSFRYLGDCISTNTTAFIPSDYMGLLGGPHGGLVNKGAIANPSGASLNLNYVMTLGDTNKVPCVIACQTPADWTGTNDFVHTFGFVKKDSGVWRFAAHKERNHGGVLDVRGGVLQFDTIDEAGRCCSLGYATTLVEPKYGGKAKEVPVDYAIRLGAKNGEEEATLEFTGSFSQSCTTRTIGVDGVGGLRNDNSSTTIRWSGVKALSGDSTLVLDGASTMSNEVAEVRDGAGGEALGIVKRGTGTWVLGGSNTFSGPVSVEAGKLIVRTVLPGAYTWFKWLMRNRNNPTSTYVVNVEEFGLYDADNKRQNRGLTLSEGYSDLQPGQCATASPYGWTQKWGSNDYSGRTEHRLFDGSAGYGFHACPRRIRDGIGATDFFIDGQPKNYMPIIMRLATGKNPISSWDYMNVWKPDNAQSINASTLYGSVDGLHWEEVDTHESDAVIGGSSTWCWSFNSEAGNQASSTHVGGRPLRQSASTVTYNPLAGNPCVSVAPGATLEAEGASPTISALSIGYSGTGAIKGFAFAAAGSIDFKGELPRGAVFVPVSLEGCTAAENLGVWRVTFNGAAIGSRSVRWTGSGFSILPMGLSILVK